jgi:hypothetical protein
MMWLAFSARVSSYGQGENSSEDHYLEGEGTATYEEPGVDLLKCFLHAFDALFQGHVGSPNSGRSQEVKACKYKSQAHTHMRVSSAFWSTCRCLHSPHSPVEQGKHEISAVSVSAEIHFVHTAKVVYVVE